MERHKEKKKDKKEKKTKKGKKSSGKSKVLALADEGPSFPVRKVVLAKTGIGYFERQDEVGGNGSFELYFKSGDMNDVLKSLTMVETSSRGGGGGSGGLVSSISYESTKPFDKQMDDLSIILNEDSSSFDLLAQVKGTTVEVEVNRGARVQRVEGVVVGLERQVQEFPDPHDMYLLSLLTPEHGVQFFDLRTIAKLTFTNELLQKDLQHLLSILLLAKKKDLKSVTGFTRGLGSGTGDKKTIRASYIVEAPVWKTSYRLLLVNKPIEDDKSKSKDKKGEEDKPKSIFQGWALVDNTQNEDWKDVELSLVAGTANSFIYDLYNPRYVKRTEIEVVAEETHAPPVLEDTVATRDLSSLSEAQASIEQRQQKAVLRAHSSSPAPPPPPPSASFGAGPPPPGAPPMKQAMAAPLSRARMSSIGMEKRKMEMEEDLCFASECAIAPSSYGESLDDLIAPESEETVHYSKSDAAQSVEVTVEGKKMEMADMFQYKITNAVTVNRNQSALVPFLQDEFKGSKVAIFNKNVQSTNPLLAIRMKNTFNMPLEGGPLSIFEDDLYVGEAMVSNISPNEEKFIAYSVELKCDVTVQEDSELRDVYRAEIGTTQWNKGQLTLMRYRVYSTVYVIDNKGERPIEQLFLEHPRRSYGTIIETAAADQTTEHFYRFKLNVPAKNVVKFVVKERESEDETHYINSVTRQEADEWFAKNFIDKAGKDKMYKIHAHNEKQTQLESERSLLYNYQSELQQDINRFDDMLGALSNSKSVNFASQAKFRDFFTKEQNEAKKEKKTVDDQITAITDQISKNERKKDRKVQGIRYSRDFEPKKPAAIPQIKLTESEGAIDLGSTSSGSGSGSGVDSTKKSPRTVFGMLARRLSDKALPKDKGSGK